MRIRTAIIPAAGKGTRLMPATKVTAKELLPVYDRVAIDFAIEEAVAVGVERIIVVISSSKTSIRSYLGEDGRVSKYNSISLRSEPRDARPELVYVFQDQALGLGHAVLCCKGITLPGPFGVILPDDIIMGTNCLSEMAAQYSSGHMIAAMQVPAEEAAQYGIFRLGGLPRDRCIPVSGMVEKPSLGTAPSSVAAVGRYILDPMIFDVLAHTPNGKGGELQLTDAITIAALASPLTAFQFSGTRYDCGNHDGLLAASNARRSLVRNPPVVATLRPAQSASASRPALDVVRVPSGNPRPAEITAVAG